MKGVRASVTRGLQVGSKVQTCDNSGAKVVQIVGVKGMRTVKGRIPAAGVGDMVMVSVVSGKPDMRSKVVPAVVVRQAKEYRRVDGMRVKFEDNSVVVLKDEKGNPKGTIFKGPIAKESVERWPAIGKVANMVL
ncbi:MAG: 50S ribosomal protein L14 [Candidatus Woesearchaeota archaeon]